MPTVLSANRGDSVSATPESAAEFRARRRRARVAIMCGILLLLLFVLGGFMSNYIPSESMEPTLTPGDHTLTMRAWLAYPMGSNPGRGDIIVFRLPTRQLDRGGSDTPDSGPAEAPPSLDQKPDYTILIKRVIGLPGDTVQIKGDVIFINDKPLKENYRTRPAIDPDAHDFQYAYYDPLKVKPGELFVLGDNRNSSDDGRFWGTLKRQDVLGKYMFVLYNDGKHGPNEQRENAKSDDTNKR
ncbi:MAG TPA: signal peptidase I [Chthonomonadaceae bacterium]|nr:signal peptidase I [Chthonomonadaceae bacterium]